MWALRAGGQTYRRQLLLPTQVHIERVLLPGSSACGIHLQGQPWVMAELLATWRVTRVLQPNFLPPGPAGMPHYCVPHPTPVAKQSQWHSGKMSHGRESMSQNKRAFLMGEDCTLTRPVGRVCKGQANWRLGSPGAFLLKDQDKHCGGSEPVKVLHAWQLCSQSRPKPVVRSVLGV